MKLLATMASALALSLSLVTPASAHGPGDQVTPAFQHPIPNIPGKTLTSVVVDYPPGGSSVSHTHAKSAFIFAYVLSGSIESQVNDGPARVYRTGESFFENPGDRHPVSRNASRTKPARLLAVFVADSGETALTTPAHR